MNASTHIIVELFSTFRVTAFDFHLRGYWIKKRPEERGGCETSPGLKGGMRRGSSIPPALSVKPIQLYVKDRFYRSKKKRNLGGDF